MNETIPLYIESIRGHDTLNIPNNPVDVQNAVESQLQDGKWVTKENSDGSSEILTAKDIPEKRKEEIASQKQQEAESEKPKDDELGDMDLDSVAKKSNENWKKAFKQDDTPKPTSTTSSSRAKPKEEWEDKFKEVKSATATSKAKGG